MFPTTAGTMMRPEFLDKLFHETQKAAGVRRAWPSRSRHTVESTNAALGIPGVATADALGHRVEVANRSYISAQAMHAQLVVETAEAVRRRLDAGVREEEIFRPKRLVG